MSVVSECYEWGIEERNRLDVILFSGKSQYTLTWYSKQLLVGMWNEWAKKASPMSCPLMRNGVSNHTPLIAKGPWCASMSTCLAGTRGEVWRNHPRRSLRSGLHGQASKRITEPLLSIPIIYPSELVLNLWWSQPWPYKAITMSRDRCMFPIVLNVWYWSLSDY